MLALSNVNIAIVGRKAPTLSGRRSHVFTNNDLCGILFFMSIERRVDTLLIPPLFYDVLSGELRPPSDPNNAVHRLGRLAYRTYEVGQAQPRNQRDRCDRYTYSPSWAQDVEATAKAEYLFGPNLHVMSGLVIKASSGEELAVHCFDANKLLFVNVNHESGATNLHLGANLESVRDEVTRLAQNLFDAVEK
jgi:hypothetical protein